MKFGNLLSRELYYPQRSLEERVTDARGKKISIFFRNKFLHRIWWDGLNEVFREDV